MKGMARTRKLPARLLLFFSITTAMSASAAPRSGSFWLLGSLHGQWQKVGQGSVLEPNKTGLGFGIGGVASYYTSSWILDGELGWMQNRVAGSSATETITNITRNGYFEFNPRFKFDSFQVGPAIDVFFGTEFDYHKYIDPENHMLILAGLHVNFDLPSDDILVRIGAKALMDIGNKEAFYLGANIQVGFDLFRKRGAHLSDEAEDEEEEDNYYNVRANERAPREVEQEVEAELPQENPPPPPPPPPAPAPAPEPVAAPAPEPEPPVSQVVAPMSVRVRLPADRLLFDYKMSHLKPKVKRFIQAFGRFLAEHTDKWKHVKIVGHTDARGKVKVNQELSEARAQTIYNALAEAGVPTDTMEVRGAASREPVKFGKGEAIWRRNRRVDLTFDGVSNPELFSEQINRLEDEHNG